jgi:hypothetical protein
VNNVLKIALNYGEDMIAAFITANFNLTLDEPMINFAIASKQIKFLQYIKSFLTPYSNLYYYQKNFIIKYNEGSKSEAVEFLSREWLLKKVVEISDNCDIEFMLNNIIEWEIKTNENLLLILNNLSYEFISNKYMDLFPQFSNYEFFYQCLSSQHDVFVK